MKKVGNRQPSIDAFADSKNNQFPRFWTRRDSAWDKDCNLERLLWINAPFDQLGKVAQKIVEDQAKAVVIAPKWTHKSWWNRLDRMSKTRYEVPEGTAVFQDAVGRVQPVKKWQTVAFLVDGALERDDESEEDVGENDCVPYVDQRDEVHRDPQNPMVRYIQRRTNSVSRKIRTVEHNPASAPSDTRSYTERIQKRFGKTALAERLQDNPPK